jgi:hypothetical protein
VTRCLPDYANARGGCSGGRASDEYIISNRDETAAFSPPSIIGELNTALYTMPRPDRVTNERAGGGGRAYRANEHAGYACARATSGRGERHLAAAKYDRYDRGA